MKCSLAFLESFFTTMPWSVRRFFLVEWSRMAGRAIGSIIDVLVTIWMTIATAGRWQMLGDYTLWLGKEIDRLSEVEREHDITKWRLDELMRFLEYRQDIIIPGNIEPPRLTGGASGEMTEEALRAGKIGPQTGGFEVPDPPSGP